METGWEYSVFCFLKRFLLGEYWLLQLKPAVQINIEEFLLTDIFDANICGKNENKNWNNKFPDAQRHQKGAEDTQTHEWVVCRERKWTRTFFLCQEARKEAGFFFFFKEKVVFIRIPKMTLTSPEFKKWCDIYHFAFQRASSVVTTTSRNDSQTIPLHDCRDKTPAVPRMKEVW